METLEKTGLKATIDLEGLRRFLRERGLGDAGDLRAENISFGHSNEVHLIHFDGRAWALRRPPRGPLLPTAHDVLREYRVLNALQPTGVPVPRVYASCEDPGYIGAPFFLMEYVRGSVIRSTTAFDPEPSFADTSARRRAVSEEMVELLVRLQSVDWRAAGLEGFGRPDGYLERQLLRWIGQLERTLPHTRPLPMMEKIQNWLRGHFPASPPATIVHGDFKLDNVMWDVSGGRPRAIALFDWEMSTLGDPLADLGWMLTYWSDPADSEARRAVVSSMETVPGYLTRAAMAELYSDRAGRAMTDFTFYEVFSLFKLAIIIEGSYSRYLRGQAGDPIFATYGERTPAVTAVAWEICRGAR
ncbi:MAG: phosphotransferase family protein [Candidatus Binataceae bacterium]